MSDGKPQQLVRDLGPVQATALNMIDMVGIGPFVVMPLVMNMMGGTAGLIAWALGALVAFVDAFTWSELGAKYPLAGGSYSFLRETFAGTQLGKIMPFLFIWQTMIQAPLVIASGSIGFSQYAAYLLPLSPIEQKMVSGAVVICLTALLYRKINTIGKISVILWVGVLLTILWIIWGGVMHFSQATFVASFNLPQELSLGFAAITGMATVQTIYCYLGYYNVCHLGGEIKAPEKIIPRSMFLSIIGITVLYLGMNIVIGGVLPLQQAQSSKFIVSTFIETIYGHQAAVVATGLILWIAFASLFAVMLGYSRVPYAAALQGDFFKVFGAVHPTKKFPHRALLFLGVVAFVFSLLFKLREVILAIIAMRILIQFIGQSVGLIYLHHKRKAEGFPFRMPLYPFPVILSICLWVLVFFSTGINFMLSGIAAVVSGLIVYAIRGRVLQRK